MRRPAARGAVSGRRAGAGAAAARGQRRPADAGGRRAAVPVQLGQQQRRARSQGRLFLVLGEKLGFAVHSDGLRVPVRAKARESGYRAGHDGDLRRRRDDPLSAERIRQQQAVLYLVHVRHDPRGGLRLDAHAAAGRSAGARAALRAVFVGERVFRRAVAGARGGFRLSALFRQRGRGGRLDSGKHRPRRRISDRAAAHQPRLLAGGAADYLRQRFVRLLPRAGLFAAIGGLQALL